MSAPQQPEYPQQQWPPAQPPKKRRRWPFVVGGLVALVVIISAVNSGGEEATPAASGSAPAAPPTSESKSAAPAPAPAVEDASNGYGKESGKYGEEIVAGGMAVTANAPKVISQQYLGDQACATISLRNTGDSPKAFSPFDWKFRTGEGVETNASIPFNAAKALNTGDLAPGGKTSGQVCADHNTSGVTALVYSPGFGIMHEVVWSK